MRGIHVK